MNGVFFSKEDWLKVQMEETDQRPRRQVTGGLTSLKY
jgi:hypothetical protein